MASLPTKEKQFSSNSFQSNAKNQSVKCFVNMWVCFNFKGAFSICPNFESIWLRLCMIENCIFVLHSVHLTEKIYFGNISYVGLRGVGYFATKFYSAERQYFVMLSSKYIEI